MRFYLSGDPIDVEILIGLFPEGSGRAFWFGKDDVGAFFVSEEIAAISDAGERHRAAEVAVTRALGIGRLLDSQLRPVALSGAQVDATGATHHVISADSAVIRLHAGVTSIIVNGVRVAEPPSPAPDILALADTDPVVAEVLDLVGKSDLSWIDLYKVHEIIKAEVGGIAGIVGKGWASKAELSAFTASANRKDVSGDAARHARPPSPDMPKVVMDLPTGQEFIRRLATAWIKSRSDGPA